MLITILKYIAGFIPEKNKFASISAVSFTIVGLIVAYLAHQQCEAKVAQIIEPYKERARQDSIYIAASNRINEDCTQEAKRQNIANQELMERVLIQEGRISNLEN
jgi:hypothetical protein